MVASCLALAAHAHTAWPSKPVKLVVAFPPGGVADVMARVVSPPLSEALGRPVIIENRAGANGNVAADTVAKAPADGYILLVGQLDDYFDPGISFPHVRTGKLKMLAVAVAATGARHCSPRCRRWAKSDTRARRPTPGSAFTRQREFLRK